MRIVNGVDAATVTHMKKSTVKVRFINDPRKLKSFTSGFFIGKVGKLAIIFTVAHLVRDVPDIEYVESEELEIVCHGSDEAYPCRIEVLMRESEILILSCDMETEIEHFYEFAPREEWEGEIQGQRVISTWRSRLLLLKST